MAGWELDALTARFPPTVLVELAVAVASPQA